MSLASRAPEPQVALRDGLRTFALAVCTLLGPSSLEPSRVDTLGSQLGKQLPRRTLVGLSRKLLKGVLRKSKSAVRCGGDSSPLGF